MNEVNIPQFELTYPPINPIEQMHISTMAKLVNRFFEPDLTDDERATIQAQLKIQGAVYAQGSQITLLGDMSRTGS